MVKELAPNEEVPLTGGLCHVVPPSGE